VGDLGGGRVRHGGTVSPAHACAPAVLRLFCENALRRGEVVQCNVRDFSAQRRRLSVLGKGLGTQKVPVTPSDSVVVALIDYLSARGEPGPNAPLFTNLARFSDGEQRLTGRGMLHIVNAYGQKVLGTALHPHALRHMAITAYLGMSDGDVRGAQRLSRHVNLLTLQVYDYNRSDLQGKATAMLSTLFGETS
jgi:integrase/recombinase XerC